jgi:hypothetical protein
MRQRLGTATEMDRAQPQVGDFAGSCRGSMATINSVSRKQHEVRVGFSRCVLSRKPIVLTEPGKSQFAPGDIKNDKDLKDAKSLASSCDGVMALVRRATSRARSGQSCRTGPTCFT